MVQISTKRFSDKNFSTKTLVVFVQKSGNKMHALGADQDVAELIEELHEDGFAMSDLKKGVFLRSVCDSHFRHLLLVGIDDKLKSLEDVRQLAAMIYQKLHANKADKAGVVIEGLTKNFKSLPDLASAFTQGAALASYEFKKYKTKKKTSDKEKSESKESEITEIFLLLSKKLNEANLKKGVLEGTIISEAICFSRDLGNTPGNLMTPELLAKAAQDGAKGTKIKVTVLDKAQIKKEGMGGLIGVSLGSAVDPRFIIMEYKGGAKSKKPVCFVGKGLTFDCGGISIKPSNGMEEMKFDMCGGANVIGTILAIAKLKLKVNVIGLVPATENMPGPLATKPGDILVSRNGKTVEIDNTDAEGRLILMDALSYASDLKPAAIFDAATLTGAVVVALGNSYTGVFTRDEKIRKRISAAAETSGEAVWHMPINDHHLQDMKGTYADLNNISSTKGAGSSTAAAFLEVFVGEGIPWAHFDIAGTAWHTGQRINYCPKKGATGVMIRTFVELAKSYF